MTTEEVMSLLRDAVANGAETVAFIGGEPLMRSDLTALADFAVDSFADVMISTNGTLVDDAFLSHFHGRHNLTVQISMDGPDEASNDAIRGRGSFSKASAAFDLARNHGIKTALSSVLNRHNYNLVGKTCDFAAGKDSIMAIFHKVHVFGRAQDNPEIMPSKQELMHGMGVLLEKFDQYENRGKMIVDFPHNRCFRGDSALDTAFLGCHFGRASAYITSEGNLACCSHLRDGEYICGSVRERSLLDIWRDSPALDMMRNMTVDDLPSCRACQVKYMCRGSCRADALGRSGALAGDPYDCEALKAYYTYVLDYYARNLKPVFP
jgi:radical SAM protein with 4Fe4S-binding SPASM domain